MCDIFPLYYSKVLSLSSSLWISCMMLPSGSITCGPCEVFILLLHAVSNLMYLCVAPVYTIPYVGLLFGGFPLHLLKLLLVCLIYSSTLVKSLLTNLSLFLSIVSVPNRHDPSGMPLVIPPILFTAVGVSLWPSDFLRRASPACPTLP